MENGSWGLFFFFSGESLSFCVRPIFLIQQANNFRDLARLACLVSDSQLMRQVSIWLCMRVRHGGQGGCDVCVVCGVCVCVWCGVLGMGMVWQDRSPMLACAHGGQSAHWTQGSVRVQWLAALSPHLQHLAFVLGFSEKTCRHTIVEAGLAFFAMNDSEDNFDLPLCPFTYLSVLDIKPKASSLTHQHECSVPEHTEALSFVSSKKWGWPPPGGTLSSTPSKGRPASLALNLIRNYFLLF